MKVNYRRWAILTYLGFLIFFSFHVLLIPGEKYKVLTTSDSGFFAGIAEEIDSANHLVDRYWRSHAPTGWPLRVQDQGQPLLTVMLYRGLSAVFPGIELMDVINYWAPLMFAVFLIGVFLAARELGGDVAGLAAVFFASVMISSIYWFKFSAYDRECLTQALSAWIIYLAILTIKRSSVGMGVLTGLVLSILALSWPGWLYLTPIILGALLLPLLYDFFKEVVLTRRFVSSLIRAFLNNWRVIVSVIVIFGVVTALCTSLGEPPNWIGFAQVLASYVGLSGGGGPALRARYASEMVAPHSFSEVMYSFYRPVYRNSTAVTIQEVLTRFLYFSIFLGVCRVLWTRRRWEWIIIPWLIILMGLVWPGKGQARFERQWWPFVAVVMGLAVSTLWWGVKKLSQEWGFSPHYFRPLPVLLLLLFVPLGQNAIAQAEHTAPPTEWAGPGFDQAYIEACEWLENNTPVDSVVAVEWSYGHLFSGASKRRTVCDGVEALGREGVWENKSEIKPPDYIYRVEGDRAYIYGVDIGGALWTLAPYKVYGRRTDVLRIRYMDSDELRWWLETYRDNWGVKIDYIVLDMWDWWLASRIEQHRAYYLTAGFGSSPLRIISSVSIENQDSILLLHFGENRENIVINTTTHQVYLARQGAPDLLMDGYIDVIADSRGNILSSQYHKSPRLPEVPETVILLRVQGQGITSAALYPSRREEIEHRGPCVGTYMYAENLPDYLERVFLSSNGLVALFKVDWAKLT